MNICLYGASSNTIDKEYIQKVEELGRMMVERGHNLVFGGGAQGLMGAAARGVFEKKGQILGVAPKFFEVDGVLFKDCTEFIYTDTMRERKRIMEENSDVFIVTPGGMGTFEEFFEILTLKQLGRHCKAIVIYNVCGFYDSMEKMMQEAMDKNFIKPECRELYEIFDDAEEMLDYIENYKGEKAGAKYFKNI